MYVLTSKASGKIDAASDGTHVRHGVPQSPEPQLTLVTDVLLDAAEVSELHRRVAAQFSGEHDGGSGGFALDPATGLRGKRLVRLGSSCCGRGPAEKAKEAHASGGSPPSSAGLGARRRSSPEQASAERSF